MTTRGEIASTMGRMWNIWARSGRNDDAARGDAHTARPPTAEALVERYRETVFAYAMRRVDNRAEAEDVAAEAFAAAFQSLHRCPALSLSDSGDADDPARAWLLGIARRKVADSCRRNARRRETPLDFLPQNAAASSANAETTVLRDEAERTIRRVMENLKPDYREALLLKYVEERSVAEIARILGRSEDAVSSLLQRARAAALQQGRDYFGGEERKQAK